MQKLSRRTKIFLFQLILIALVGMALRTVVSFEMISHDPDAYAPGNGTDMEAYKNLSDDILSGKWPDAFYFQPFYYSVFVPFFKLLFGTGPWAAALGQILCSGGIIFLAGLTAAMLWGRKAGLITGTMCALSTFLVFYVPYMLIEIQLGFWLALLLYLCMRAMKVQSAVLWSACGLILGIAILSRGNSWFLMPAILLGLFASMGVRRLKTWLAALLFAAFIILPQIPFSMYNSIKSGAMTGPATGGPATLALGNTPEAPPGFMTYTETFTYWLNTNEKVPVTRRIMEWVKQEPLAFLELSFRKYLLFWDYREIPNNLNLKINGKHSSFLTLAFIPTGVIIMLAAAGFLLLMPKMLKNKKILILSSLPPCYAAGVAVFYIIDRFRIALLPILCIISSYAVIYLCGILKRHGFSGKYLIKPFMALTAGAILTFWAYDYYRFYIEPQMMSIARPHGVNTIVRDGNTLLFYDSGPEMLGSWTKVPLQEGLVISKNIFPREDVKGKTLTLILPLVTTGANSFMMSVNNGPPQRISLPQPKEPDPQSTLLITLETPCPENMVFNIRFAAIKNSNTSFYIDLQRNYGRTHINGEALPAELVALFFYTEGNR